MSFGRLSSYLTETGADSRNLGRWTYLKISNAFKTARVVIAYRPCMPGSIRRQGKDPECRMVQEQHDRYFRAQEKERDLLEMFDYDLLHALHE